MRETEMKRRERGSFKFRKNRKFSVFLVTALIDLISEKFDGNLREKKREREKEKRD